MKTVAIQHAHELWNHKIWTPYTYLPNQDAAVSQALMAAVAVMPSGERVLLQFGVNKTVTRRAKQDARFAGIDAEKTAQAELFMKDLLTGFFVQGHYPKEKAFYWSYDFRYGQTEFAEDDMRSKHGFFYRRMVYPIKERFRVWDLNRKARVGSAFEKDGKYWFKYDRLEAVVNP